MRIVNDSHSCNRLIDLNRLWHQLTVKVLAFYADPQSKPYRVDVFEKFVRDFEGRLNYLRLVEMGVIASREIDSAYYFLNS